ncbi:hypothetical protein [Roseibium sediminicola]|uniref:Solute-binding protein family 3/N-terminal domain-containing protein n=1 Tax=Roseibium sediminicola TaxID=2933272 RepID=A0ABT0H2B3_9HYPH|nr:hypothetical protein [Roseibium sp. CAU 1639]MCK7615834.1 hypothetical protein [Roseibium sp. CAU 1639]
MTRAYDELGIRIEAVQASPRRALLDAASGKTDGELVRIKDVGADHESLIRVDVPIVVARTYAYAVNPGLRGKSFDELKHLRIGHIAGARFAVELAEGFTEIWTAESPEQLFEMLRRDRIDLVIAGEGTGQRLSRELDMPEVFPIEPSLHSVAFYHFLHESHADLVPKIEDVLRRQLKRSSGETYEDRKSREIIPDRNILHKTGMSS